MTTTPPSSLRARVLEATRKEPSATRAAASRQIAWIIAVAIVVDLGAFVLLGGVHSGRRPPWLILVTDGASMLFALLAAWGAFGRGRSMLGRPRRLLLAITVATPLVLLSWLLSWSAVCPATELSSSGHIGLRCLGLSLVLAAWPLALLIRFRREKNPLTSAATGAARGVAIGALAWVLVSLWCPQTGAAHLALGHFLPLILLSLFGAWFGRRVTGVAR